MAKIDLSGNSGWQSKSGDKIQSLQDGTYDYQELNLRPNQVSIDWIHDALIVQVLEGQLILRYADHDLEYEKDQIIYFNQENMIGLELIVDHQVKLGLFSEKANK